jgi:hypothetical protein
VLKKTFKRGDRVRWLGFGQPKLQTGKSYVVSKIWINWKGGNPEFLELEEFPDSFPIKDFVLVK